VNIIDGGNGSLYRKLKDWPPREHIVNSIRTKVVL
jgi:hypothetical protein